MMAIPHDVQMQLIRKRLKDLEGKAKKKEIDTIIEELPGYKTGPYAEIRKWLRKEKEKTAVRSKIKHHDWLSVKKEGVRQFVLIGKPSVGKSSLIKGLSGLQTKVADYEFTTLRPIPGVVHINDAPIQIVDLPGLIEGATDDAGSGRRFIAMARDADGIILMHDLTRPVNEVKAMKNELEKAQIDRPMVIVGNKADLPQASPEALREAFPGHDVVMVSAEEGNGFNRLKDAIWKRSGLIRVHAKGEPIVLEEGATVKDLAKKIHGGLSKKVRHARVSGESAKFPNQQVGLHHVLADEDSIELVLR